MTHVFVAPASRRQFFNVPRMEKMPARRRRHKNHQPPGESETVASAARFLCEECGLGSNQIGLLQRRKTLDGFSSFLFGETKFVKILQVEPEFRCCAKEMGQAQRRVARDS